jgi:hypothetical protein
LPPILAAVALSGSGKPEAVVGPLAKALHASILGCPAVVAALKNDDMAVLRFAIQKGTLHAPAGNSPAGAVDCLGAALEGSVVALEDGLQMRIELRSESADLRGQP